MAPKPDPNVSVKPSPAASPPSIPVAVRVPVQPHAFVLNAAACDAGASYIAPIVQPDYRALRPGQTLKHDILSHIDLQGCESSKANPRIRTLTRTPGFGREGIYLHWTLPPLFRTGTAKTKSANQNDDLQERAAPDRWILVRHLSIPPAPSNPPAKTAVPFTHVSEMFMIESNRIRRIQDKDLDNLDIQCEMAPFVDPAVGFEKQGDCYVGRKFGMADWHEQEDSSGKTPSSVHLHPFTILGASNPFFADCQAHNPNVFSVHDDLSYSIWNAKSGMFGVPTIPSVASVSYFLVGYYNILTHDPFFLSENPATKRSFTKFRMKLPEEQSDELFPKQTDKASKEQTDKMKTVSPVRLTLVCHGELNNIVWNEKAGPKTRVAHDAAILFRTGHLLSVGEELVDAVSAWFSNATKPKAQALATAFKDLQLLAHNPDDHDEVMLKTTQQMNAAFEPAEGGQTWRFVRKSNAKDKTDPDAAPVPAHEIEKLRALDAAQRLQDTCGRQTAFLKHSLYCEWWKNRAVSVGEDLLKTATESRAAELLKTLELFRSGQTGSGLVAELQKVVDYIAPPKSGIYEKVPNNKFYSYKDPSIALVGVQSDWLFDPSQLIQVDLLYSNLVPYKSTGTDGLDHIVKLPSWLQSIYVGIYQQWISKAGINTQQELDNNTNASTQGFYPLFVEWEAEYCHIPWSQWTLRERPNGLVTYELTTEGSLSMRKELPSQPRGLAGRTPIVPEPAKSVKDQIEIILRRSRQDAMQTILNEDDQKALTSQLLDQKTLLSGTLDGLSDHLLTLAHGIHLIPNPKAEPTALYDKDPFASPQAHFHLDNLKTMGVTPYGHVPVDGLSAHFEGQSNAPLFRPVIHGQMRFTKFNIVDKFGQVIRGIEYKGKDSSQPREKLYPRVSSAMACQTESKSQLPLTPVAEDMGQTEFFQLAPRINQKVRLNAHFVVPEESFQGWRAALEWENPVWAWLVINFKDTSLQIYQGDGKFRAELLIGVGDTIEWINPTHRTDDVVKVTKDSQDEIERLMFKLQSDRKHRDNVWNMLIEANENIHHAPSSYGDFLPALLGRPMAMVHTGFSLELAHEQMRDQSLGAKAGTPADPSVKKLDEYEFEIKIGHKHSLHDGFVALIPQLAPAKNATQQDPIRFDYDQMYTYFGHGRENDDTPKPPLVPPTKLCALSPYFIDPASYTASPASIVAFQRVHFAKLRVFACIIDPFHATHIFSGIMPMRTLQIPPWILEQTLSRMTILFRAGPLLIPGDVPSEAAIAAANSKAFNRNPNVTRAHIKIPVDAPSASSWEWAQPVRDEQGKRGVRVFQTKAMDRSFNLPKGPATAVEGFLGVAGPPAGAYRHQETADDAKASTTASSGSVGTAAPPVTMDSVLAEAVAKTIAPKKP